MWLSAIINIPLSAIINIPFPNTRHFRNERQRFVTHGNKDLSLDNLGYTVNSVPIPILQENSKINWL